MVSKGAVANLEKLIMSVQYKGEEIELVNRIMNLLAKLARHPSGQKQIAESKNILLRTLLYFNRNFQPLVYNSLRIFHACCKFPEFRNICLEVHKFTLKNFDSYTKEVLEMFKDSLERQEWDNFVNCCSSVSGFSEVFPERAVDF